MRGCPKNVSMFEELIMFSSLVCPRKAVVETNRVWVVTLDVSSLVSTMRAT